MTLFSIPPLLGVIGSAFRMHNSGVPVLGSLLSVIVVDAPSDPARIVLENLALWLVLYGGATLLLYFTPKWRSPWLLSFKFNNNPSRQPTTFPACGTVMGRDPALPT